MLVFCSQHFIIYILQGQQVEMSDLGQSWESQVIELDKGRTEYLSSQRGGVGVMCWEKFEEKWEGKEIMRHGIRKGR